MSEPVDVADDFLRTRGQIELVTVESLDVDLPDGSNVLATATGVRAIVGKEVDSEQSVGGGAVGAAQRDFTLVVADVGFVVSNRDRITRADGTKWITGNVIVGGFGALFDCKGCVQQRG